MGLGREVSAAEEYSVRLRRLVSDFHAFNRDPSFFDLKYAQHGDRGTLLAQVEITLAGGSIVRKVDGCQRSKCSGRGAPSLAKLFAVPVFVAIR